MTKQEIYVYIGCGVTGATLFWQHIKALSTSAEFRNGELGEIKIFIIDKSGTYGKGLAFGDSALNYHLSNAELYTSSIDPHNKNDIMDWIQSNYDALISEHGFFDSHELSFIPRKIIGKYFNHRFQEALALSKKIGVAVKLYALEAINILVNETNVEVALNNDDTILADKVVMATGHWKPNQVNEFKVFGDELLKNKKGGYFNAWNTEDLRTKIPKNCKIGILGASTSAIDAVLTLTSTKSTPAFNLNKQIQLHSRSGVLPKVKSIHQPSALENPFLIKDDVKILTQNYTTNISYNSVVELFMKRIKYAYTAPITDDTAFNSTEFSWANFTKKADHWDINKMIVELNKDIQNAKSKDERWNNVHYAIRGSFRALARIYPHFSLEDKIKFQEEFHRPLLAHAGAIPLQNAERLLSLLKAGNLRLFAGFKKITINEELAQFDVCSELTSGEKRIDSYNYIINATGQNKNCRTCPSQLMQNMIKNNDVSLGHSGALNVDYETSAVIKANGAASKKLYAIGVMTLGERIGSSAIVASVKFSSRLVSSFMLDLKNKKA